MHYIILDLEMNEIDHSHKTEFRICSKEIIQIGAVLLDDTYQILDTFSIYCKPQYNTGISYKYQQLTGISTYTVKDAPCFKVALNQFFTWILSNTNDVELYSWSDNDYNQILDEAQLKNYRFSDQELQLLEQWYDLQEEYDEITQRHYRCSLVEALISSGISFEGKQHDALYDSINTAKLFKTIRKNNHIEQTYNRYLNQEPVNATLGDCIDFSKLQFN